MRFLNKINGDKIINDIIISMIIFGLLCLSTDLDMDKKITNIYPEGFYVLTELDFQTSKPINVTFFNQMDKVETNKSFFLGKNKYQYSYQYKVGTEKYNYDKYYFHISKFKNFEDSQKFIYNFEKKRESETAGNEFLNILKTNPQSTQTENTVKEAVNEQPVNNVLKTSNIEYSKSINVFKTNKGKEGWIDTNGKIISQGFDDCYEFKEGFGVFKKDNKFGFIDTKGNIMLEGFEYLSDFEKGFAKFKKDGGYGLVDTDGNILILNMSDVFPFGEEGYALVIDESNNTFWIDTKGKTYDVKPY